MGADTRSFHNFPQQNAQDHRLYFLFRVHEMASEPKPMAHMEIMMRRMMAPLARSDELERLGTQLVEI